MSDRETGIYSINPKEIVPYSPPEPFYDPARSYEENYSNGPFGTFSDGKRFFQEGEPDYEVFGNKVYLPFGIPAGPLLNSGYVTAAFEKGFDIAVYKTVRTRKYPSLSFPNVLAVHPKGDLTLDIAQDGLVADTNYEIPFGITNSFGVPSQGPDIWQPDMANAVDSASEGQLLIGSFQGTTGGSEEEFIEDFVTAARLVKETRAKVLEANLSCPNEGTSQLLCYDLNRAEKVVRALKNEIGNTPLIVKIAYFAQFEQLLEFVDRVGRNADGIGAINTIPTKIWMNSDRIEPALPGSSRLIAGVCGEPIKWAGLDMVRRLDQIRQDKGYSYLIFGTGGVTNPDDYLDYKEAGADAVMSATGAMWNPYLAQEIKE
jgi:dihydroorotate dehydrogenase (NAD+) catalytic subunit